MRERYTLTKLDIAALRKADSLAIHLHSQKPDGLVRAIKRKHKSVADPYAEDIEHTIPAPVVVDGFGSYTVEQLSDRLARGAKCFELVNLYPSQGCHASSVIRTLRAGDEIEFRFHPDAHSNGYAAEKDLHGDVLNLAVYRKGKHAATWELETSICPDNSARMCFGLTRESYYKDQKRMREKGCV